MISFSNPLLVTPADSPSPYPKVLTNCLLRFIIVITRDSSKSRRVENLISTKVTMATGELYCSGCCQHVQ